MTAGGLDLDEPTEALRQAAVYLGLTLQARGLPELLSEAVAAWPGQLKRWHDAAH